MSNRKESPMPKSDPHIRRIYVSDDKTMQMVRGISMVKSLGFSVHLPPDGIPSFSHPLKAMTRDYKALLEEVCEICTGKVRSCPGHSCQALFYWDQDGLWHCMNPKCHYYRNPVHQSDMVAYDYICKNAERDILKRDTYIPYLGMVAAS